MNTHLGWIDLSDSVFLCGRITLLSFTHATPFRFLNLTYEWSSGKITFSNKVARRFNTLSV